MAPIVALVIEDDAALRGLYRNILTLEGFEVREAEDGLNALHRIDEGLPAVIILDMMLPRISGYGVLHDLAAQPHTRHIPVIVVTGTIGRVDHPGVTCVLRKPVTAEALMDAIRRSTEADAV